MEPSEVADVVGRAATGDASAWNALVESYSGLVWAVASSFRLGSADTSEVVQTTWLRLVEHLDRLTHPERVGGWLATTARHEALRQLRLRGRESPVEDVEQVLGEPGAGVVSPEAEAIVADRDRLVRAAYDRLPENCRMLLWLCVVERPPYTEISELLDMRIGSIGPTRARCLERLRRLLAADGITSAAGGG